MLFGLNYYQQNLDQLRESLKRRNLDTALADKFQQLKEERSRITLELEGKRNERNQHTGVPDEETRSKLKILSDEIKSLEEKLSETEFDLSEVIKTFPNLVSASTPNGGEEDFKEIKKWGEINKIENPKDHEQLGKELDLIDFEAGVKVSGAKFYYLKNEAVWLEFALIMYVMNLLKGEEFVPMITPDIVKNDVLEGIGFTPKGPEKQVYGLDEEDLSLIGTAEITLGGYHKDEILKEEDLPIKYLGFSTCFRTEAGAYGKHSKGLYRVHQFDKLEMFIYCLPEDSEKMHQYLLDLEEKIFQGLGIPYRVTDIAASDLGAPAFKKYDVEAWMPGRGDYGEVTSTSNTTNYQSMRLNVKYEKDGQKDYAHTLNGTAIAVSRALIAILENFQQADGSIKIPEVLVPYTGFSEIKPK